MQRVNVTNEFIVTVFFILLISFLFSPESKATSIEYSKLEKAEWLDGKPVEIVSEVRKRRVTILQFWASWCAGCGENMVTLSQIQDNFKRLQTDVGFFPITIDDEKADAANYFRLAGDKEFLKAYPNTIWDKDMKFTESVKVESVPYLIVVDHNGNIKKSFAGHISGAVKDDIIKVIDEAYRGGSALKIVKEDK